MKRVLAVSLSFLLAVVCLYGIMPVSAWNLGPTGANLVTGGDFANGTGYTTSTTLPGATDTFVTGLNYKTWFRATALTGAIANDTDTYGNYLHSKQYALQAVPFATGKTYTLRFETRGQVGLTTDQLRVYVCSATNRALPLSIGSVTINGTSNVATTYMNLQKSTTWTRYTLTFKVNATLTAGTAYCISFFDFDYTSTNAIAFDLDNVELYDNETMFSNALVADGSFEYTQNTTNANNSATTTLPVIKQQAATTTPTNIWHQAQGDSYLSRITTEASHTGRASIIVNPTLYQGVSTLAGGVYRLEFWAKSRNYGGLAFRFVSTDNRASAINTEGSRTVMLTNEWVKYTYTITMPAAVSGTTILSFFTNNNTDPYGNYNANDVFVDDVTLNSGYALSATAESSGSAAVSSSVAAQGEQVTFTATPDSGATFLGWFVSGNTTPVSTEASYVVTVTGDLNLTAKFQRTVFGGEGNLLYDGDFTNTTSIPQAEGYDTVTYDSAHIWYQPPGSSSIQSENGNNYAKFSFLYQSVQIQANKIYRLTYKAKTAEVGVGVTASLRALKDRTTILKSSTVQPIDSNSVWRTYTAIFKVGNLNSSYSDYALALNRSSGTEVFVDDVILEEFNNTVSVGYVGAAIRTALVPPNYAQGLRFKSSITHDMINTQLANGYSLVEYGHIAIKTEYLDGQPLVVDGTYQYGTDVKLAKKGVAYNVTNGINVTFSDDGTTKQFTAVLIGITAENYMANYTVRPYVIYKNAGGETIVCYGDEQTASVYQIASLAYAAAGNGQGGFNESRETRLDLFSILNAGNSAVYPSFVENRADLPVSQNP